LYEKRNDCIPCWNSWPRGSALPLSPTPLCNPSDRVVFKKLEDLDLGANLQLTWLRNNDFRIAEGIYRDHT
jgi:hypothetical protein